MWLLTFTPWGTRMHAHLWPFSDALGLIIKNSEQKTPLLNMKVVLKNFFLGMTWKNDFS
jgi:hypothetical protein